MAGVTGAATGVEVSWESVATRSYWLERAGDLGVAPLFTTVATNIPGIDGIRIFNDTGATGDNLYLSLSYRSGVIPGQG